MSRIVSERFSEKSGMRIIEEDDSLMVCVRESSLGLYTRPFVVPKVKPLVLPPEPTHRPWDTGMAFFGDEVDEPEELNFDYARQRVEIPVCDIDRD